MLQIDSVVDFFSLESFLAELKHEAEVGVDCVRVDVVEDAKSMTHTEIYAHAGFIKDHQLRQMVLPCGVNYTPEDAATRVAKNIVEQIATLCDAYDVDVRNGVISTGPMNGS